MNASALAASEGSFAAASSATIAISVSVRPRAALAQISAAMVAGRRSEAFHVTAECGRDSERQAPLGFDALITLTAPQSSNFLAERQAFAAARPTELLLAGTCLVAGTIEQPANDAARSVQTSAGLTVVIAPR
jgi:hypothetical protein